MVKLEAGEHVDRVGAQENLASGYECLPNYFGTFRRIKCVFDDDFRLLCFHPFKRPRVGHGVLLVRLEHGSF